MLSDETVSRNRILQVDIPVAGISFGATRNQIPKPPGFNWDLLKTETEDL
jgi:hypothetical protein